MIKPNFFPLIVGLISLILALLITPIVILFAKKMNWVVMPRKDRWHSKPTALMGGISIFFSFIISLLFFDFKNQDWIFLTACIVMFLTGFVDDIKEVKPIVKLLGQITCTFAIIYNGYIFGGSLFIWIGIPLTFLWVIGITNAINLLDNMDGLSAGITATISLVIGIIFYWDGNYFLSTIAFSLTGATIGFLYYNFNPAKIFMGDCGSLFIGFVVSFLTLGLQKSVKSTSSILVLIIPIALMAIPIMDTSLVTIKRLISGRKIQQGGRDHVSHRLVALGLSEKKAVIILYLISISWGIICLFINQLDIFKFPLLLLMTIFSIIFALILSNVKVYNESEEKLAYLRSRGYGKLDSFFIRFFLMNKKLVLGIVIDICVICSSFFVAVSLSNIILNQDSYLLALFILVKLLVFYTFNLYNRLWRYISTIELVNHFFSVFCSTILLYFLLYLLKPITNFNLEFFTIDFFVTMTGILFARISYRAIQDLFNVGSSQAKKVLIYGAGNSGYFLLKELSNNDRYDYKVVGFIDDDRIKHNMVFNGVKILGGIHKLKSIIDSKNPDLIIISTSSISLGNLDIVKKIVDESNIDLAHFNVNIDFR